MSNLVEAVAKAIHENSSAEDEVFGNDAMSNLYRHPARAAILAVLEHYSEAGNVNEKMATAALRYDSVYADYHRIISEALRAELERLRGEG